MKVTRASGENGSEEAEARRKAAIKFICIPGARPVRVPADTPQSKAMISSIIMLYSWTKFYNCPYQITRKVTFLILTFHFFFNSSENLFYMLKLKTLLSL